MADITDLMLATGCRIGEILGLRWSDLDLDGDLPILTVSGTIKTDRKGHLSEAHAAVGRQLANRCAPPVRGRVVNVERRWRQISKDTGFEWMTPTRSARRWRR